MMFEWFNAKEAQKFGESLAVFFIERFPLEDARKKDKLLKKRQDVMEKMFLQITDFKTRNKLNVYKKAKLGNAFKWKLIEANYDPEVVDTLTHTLLLRI
jgi:hypothetical protein